jgi:hypothetical protein
VFYFSNIKKKKRLPYYFILENFKQKQPFLVQRLVQVAGWLWAFHKVVQCLANLNYSAAKTKKGIQRIDLK